MTVKFTTANCKVYNYEQDRIVNIEMMFKNERTLRRNIKEAGCMLIEYEKVVEEYELTDEQAMMLRQICKDKTNQNESEEE